MNRHLNFLILPLLLLWSNQAGAQPAGASDQEIVAESAAGNATLGEMRAFFDILLDGHDPKKAPWGKQNDKARDFLIVKFLATRALAQGIEKGETLARHRTWCLLETCRRAMEGKNIPDLVTIHSVTESEALAAYNNHRSFWDEPRYFQIESIAIDKASMELGRSDNKADQLKEIQARAELSHKAATQGMAFAQIGSQYARRPLDTVILNSKLPDLDQPSFSHNVVPRESLIKALREAKPGEVLPLLDTPQSFMIVRLKGIIPKPEPRAWDETRKLIISYLTEKQVSDARSQALVRADKECAYVVSLDPLTSKPMREDIVLATASFAGRHWTYTVSDMRRDMLIDGKHSLPETQPEIDNWEAWLKRELREGIAGWLIGAASSPSIVRRAEIELQRDLAAMEQHRMFETCLGETPEQPGDADIAAHYINNATWFREPERVDLDVLSVWCLSKGDNLAVARVARLEIESILAGVTRGATSEGGLAGAYRTLAGSSDEPNPIEGLRAYLQKEGMDLQIRFYPGWRVTADDLFPYGIWNGPNTILTAPLKTLVQTPPPPGIARAADNARPVGVAYWFVREKTPAGTPPLDAIRDLVIQDWRRNRASDKLKQEMTAIVETLNIRIDDAVLVRI